MSEEKQLLNAVEQGDLKFIKEFLHGVGAKFRKNVEGLLFFAITKGQLEIVQYLIKECGAKIDKKDNDGITALMGASLIGHLEIVQYLVKECEVSVDEKDNDGRTALIWSALVGHLSIVQYLVKECGAKVDEESKYGLTPLSSAAQNGHLEVVRYLVKECGAKVEVEYGSTALSSAILGGFLEVVRYLLKEWRNKVDEKMRYGGEYGALLCFSAEKGHLEILRYLMKKCGLEISEKNKYGINAFSSAAQNGHLEVVQYLVNECGVRIDEKSKYQPPALSKSAANGHLEVVRYLLKECGAKIDERWDDGTTALSSAAERGQLEVVRYLVKECGAEVDEKGKYAFTALSLAAQNGHLGVVRYLVKECGAKVDEKHVGGETALLLSVRSGRGCLEIVQCLVKEGKAKVDEKDKKERTALIYAAENGYLEVVSCLVIDGKAKVDEKDKYGCTALFTAARRGHLEVVRFLAKEGSAKVDEKDKYGLTPLSSAAQNGHLGIVRYLVKECGAKVDEKDNQGTTALFKATEEGHLEVVRYLVKECEVKVDEKDNDGRNALFGAAKNGHLEVVRYLVKECGANVEENDNDGRTTPLFWAVQNRHLEIVRYLVFNKNVRVEKKVVDMASRSHGTQFFLECCYLSQSAKTFPVLFQKLSEADRFCREFNFRTLLITLLFRFYSENKKHFPKNSHSIIFDWLSQFSVRELSVVIQIAIRYKYLIVFSEIKNYCEPVFVLNEVVIDEEAMIAIALFFKNNSILHVLQFCNVEFTKKGYEKFLEFLGDKISRLETVALDDCNLSNVEVQALARCLSNAIKLKSLNLNNNKITNAGFEYLIAGLSRELKELSLVNNFIDYDDAPRTHKDLKILSAKCLMGTNIAINLSGNLIESNEHRPHAKKIVMWILMRADLCIEDFLNSKFDRLYKKDDDCNILQLSLNDKVWKIDLNRAETSLINEEKVSQQCSTDDEFFSSLLKMRGAILSMKGDFLAQKFYGKTEKEVVPARKILLDYHPDAPLKSYIRTHSFFRSSQLVSVKSLLLPHLDITVDGWKVYFLAKKSGAKDILKQHAWLAYEGLTKHGQRFLKVANLTTPNNGYWEQFKNIVKGGGVPNISFFVWENSQLKTVEYLKEHCIIAGFTATRTQVKKMHAVVQGELEKLPQRYKMIISSSSHPTKDDKSKEVVNCAKWAINKLEDCIGIKIPDEYKGAFIPSEVVNNLVTLSKSRQAQEKLRVYKH